MDFVWVFLLLSVSLSHVTAAGFHKFDSAFDTDDIDVVSGETFFMLKSTEHEIYHAHQ